MKLFEYAVLFTPKAKEKKSNERAKLIVPVTVVVARDAQEATLLAARSIPDAYATKLDQVEVAVRPF